MNNPPPAGRRLAGRIADGLLTLAILFSFARAKSGSVPPMFRVGEAECAFDHLGTMDDLADVAAASGVNIIFTGGVGSFGYLGLPGQAKLDAACQDERNYLKEARAKGIKATIGYVCATSIVKLNAFDTNWTRPFRAQFHSSPAQWRQVGANGQPLPSWYGAPYEPACMNNPDWRLYEKAVVKMQLDSGCDGIFFDNPTVHPQGCYCPFCMKKFKTFLVTKPGKQPEDQSTEGLRRWAIDHPSKFLEFRSTIAADFLAEMRQYARSVKRGALVTCNNSLNSPTTFFSQIRAMGYDINTMSHAEDFLTIEDMGSEARALPDGRTVEYAPTYHLLHAISHGRPIVATTLADADYHSSSNLACLSMAEAAANDATWMVWPTWPENLRRPMERSILPEAQLLRSRSSLFEHAEPRCDVLLYFCFRRWLESGTCAASALAQTLTEENIQYRVCTEEDLLAALTAKHPHVPVLLVESHSTLNGEEEHHLKTFQKHGGRVVYADETNWMSQARAALPKPSLLLHGPSSIRAVLHDFPGGQIIHLYNLNVERLSSFEDRVHPSEEIGITIRARIHHVLSVRALTADQQTTSGPLKFTTRPDGEDLIVETTLPKLETSAMLVVSGP